MNTKESERQYHHGNLKQVLVDAYLELLPTMPREQLSMRKLCAHIGVAQTAVYNHFKNKDELAVAVKIRCLEHFADYLDDRAKTEDNAHGQIKALGQAYFQYAYENAQYFELLMGDHVPDELVTEELMQAGMRAESALRASVVALLKEHDLPTNQYNEGLGSLACWSVAHGITSIASMRLNQVACADGRWPETFQLSTPEQVNASFEIMTDVLVAGILKAAKRDANES